ncbi:DNA polymerase delta subunit 4-like protein [Choanephora cucurbitarum]|nr:DNA polymerase delta subunit 4-like protein [Choanephora cucurbitarum]
MPSTKQEPIKFTRAKRYTNLQKQKLDPAVIQIGREQTTEDNVDVKDILRAFDLNLAYGPCIGITRLQRWERAYALGQNPPRIVKEILKETQKYNHCLFDEYRMI